MTYTTQTTTSKGKIFRGFILFTLLFVTYLSVGKEPGKPFMTLFSPKDYMGETQNWCITEDNRGFLYVGNNTGVLEYDGLNWRTILLSNKSLGRSLAVDKQGTVYVGGSGDFGKLIISPTGQRIYQSLTHLLPSNQKFDNVWRTYITKNGDVYFCTLTGIFKYNGETIQEINLHNKALFRVCFAHNRLLVNGKNEPALYEIINGEIKEIVPSSVGKRLGITNFFTALPLPNGEILLGDGSKGLFVLRKGNKLEKYNSPANAILTKGMLLYYGQALPSGNLAIATIRNGFVVLNPQGEVLAHYTQESGLPTNDIYGIYGDQQGGIWAGMAKGIARINLGLPITYYQEGVTFSGSPIAITKFNNNTYLSTGAGAYRITDQEQFIPISSRQATQCWDFSIAQPANSKPQLLLGTSSGLVKVENNTTIPQPTIVPLQRNNVYMAINYSKNKNWVLLAQSPGISIATYQKNGSWLQLHAMADFNYEIRSIACDTAGFAWLGTSYDGIIRINPYIENDSLKSSSTITYGTEHGLPENHGITVSYINNQLYAATSKGVYRYNESQDLFVNTHLLPSDWDGNIIQGIVQDSHHNFWVYPKRTGNKTITKISIQGKDTTQWDTPFHQLPIMDMEDLYIDQEEKRIYCLGSEGIFIYKETSDKQFIYPFNTHITNVSVKDSLLFAAGDQTNISNLSSDMNNLSFRFSATAFNSINKNLRYSYKLEGFDQDWSAFSPLNLKEYTNLGAGTYTFKVKAKDVYGTQGKESSYQFSIAAAWYLTWWAIVGYIVLLNLLIFIIVKYNTRRLSNENIKLERIVAERTKEVVDQKDELEQQANNLKEANKKINERNEQITDSLRYGETIQRAILPVHKRLDRYFPDHFELYLPKDIVSGDFYWFTRINISESQRMLFLTAADCTGHGVPGAFMSMVGSSLLNYVVIEKKISDPKEILEELNMGIIQALRQEKNDNVDGMDICLIRIDQDLNTPDTHTITFGGARRPLYYINPTESDQLQTLKGSTKRIGGAQSTKKSKNRAFTEETIILPTGSKLYLTTDGYMDQCNPEKKKIGTLKFMEILQENSNQPMQQQQAILLHHLKEHQQNHEQRDDITILGISI